VVEQLFNASEKRLGVVLGDWSNKSLHPGRAGVVCPRRKMGRRATTLMRVCPEQL